MNRYCYSQRHRVLLITQDVAISHTVNVAELPHALDEAPASLHFIVRSPQPSVIAIYATVPSPKTKARRRVDRRLLNFWPLVHLFVPIVMLS